MNEQDIKQYYHERKINLIISYGSSVFGGLVAGLMVALALGQTPSEIYKKFGMPLIWWGLILIIIVFAYGLVLYFALIFLPKKQDLKIIKTNFWGNEPS